MALSVETEPHGFVEAWLRRCGERPRRTFFRLWLFLLVPALICMFVGRQHTRFSGLPPDPRGIDYSSFAAGGAMAQAWDFSIDVADAPALDPALQRPEVGVSPRRGKGGQPSSIEAHVPHFVGASGWPWMSMAWSQSEVLDVTHPAQAFRSIPDSYRCGFSWGSTELGVTLVDHDGSRGTGVSIHLPGALVQFAAPQLASGIVVLSFVAAFRLRQRRRCKIGACLNCGQVLDPARSIGTCPECGSIENDGDIAAHRSSLIHCARLNGLSIVTFALLLGVWLTIQYCNYDPTNVKPLQEQIEARTSGAPFAYVGHLCDICGGWGWPANLVSRQHDYWFAFAPSQPAQPAPGRFRSGVDDHSLQWVIDDGDPSVTTLVTVNWAMIAFQLALLQIAAVLAAVSIRLVRRIVPKPTIRITP